MPTIRRPRYLVGVILNIVCIQTTEYLYRQPNNIGSSLVRLRTQKWVENDQGENIWQKITSKYAFEISVGECQIVVYYKRSFKFLFPPLLSFFSSLPSRGGNG